MRILSNQMMSIEWAKPVGTGIIRHKNFRTLEAEGRTYKRVAPVPILKASC